MSETLPASARLLHDLGGGMRLVSTELDTLREQNLNAWVMSTEQFKSLVNNIKRRGQMESTPYCHLRDGQIWIVSGHHRIRAAASGRPQGSGHHVGDPGAQPVGRDGQADRPQTRLQAGTTRTCSAP